MRSSQGFSLVELMIVVAIIGVLASIAVPNYLRATARAKRAEVPANVAGIRDAQMAYGASYDDYVHLNEAPRTMAALTNEAVAWPGTAGPEWEMLGWEPDGAVRGVYAGIEMPNDFKVEGHSDVDFDGAIAHFQATVSNRVTMTSVESVY